jgi:hypothetical protein
LSAAFVYSPQQLYSPVTSPNRSSSSVPQTSSISTSSTYTPLSPDGFNCTPGGHSLRLFGARTACAAAVAVAPTAKVDTVNRFPLDSASRRIPPSFTSYVRPDPARRIQLMASRKDRRDRQRPGAGNGEQPDSWQLPLEFRKVPTLHSRHMLNG